MKIWSIVAALAIYHATLASASAGILMHSTKLSFSTPPADAPGKFSFLPDSNGSESLITGTPAFAGDTPTIVTIHNRSNWSYLNEPFSVADITYTNGVNRAGTILDVIPMHMQLSMTPLFWWCGCSPTQQAELSFDLRINATPNYTGDSDRDADSLVIEGQTSSIVSMLGTKFKVEILGFSNDGCSFSQEFVLAENATAVMGLYARVTPHCVPEPSSFAMCGIGCLGLVGFVRRYRRNACANSVR